jgi:hypothetical protein
MRQPIPVVATPFNEAFGRLSPDSQWLAYVSDESGKAEVYVQAFPAGNSRRQVSSGGGGHPLWRGDGKEIYFLKLTEDPNRVMAAGIRTSSSGIEVDPARELFTEPAFRNGVGMPCGAVASDGQRFLIESPVRDAVGPLFVLANWQAALKK